MILTDQIALRGYIFTFYSFCISYGFGQKCVGFTPVNKITYQQYHPKIP